MSANSKESASKHCRVIQRAKDFDHLDSAVAEGIHGFLRQLRSSCPVARSEKYGGFYVVSTHDRIMEVGSDHARFSAACEGLGAVMLMPEFAETKAPLFELDPPKQTEWRRLLQPFFSSTAVARHEPYVRAVTQRFLEPLRARGHADFVAELAVLIPPIIVGELFALPEEERPAFSLLVRSFFAAGSLPEKEARELAARYGAYLRQLVAGRRGHQGSDLLTAVVNTPVSGRLANDAELLKFAFLMVAAGHLTTTDTIANTLLVLAEDGELQQRVRENLDLVPALVEESVRYESAVAATGRTVRVPTTLEGVKLDVGDRLLLTWGSGARDETRYEDPDRFLVDRAQPSRHIGWGAGVHRCLGMRLARLELRVVIEEILRAVPPFRLATNARIERTYGVIRGVRAVPAVWEL
ncbi:MAG TPA: cytochrome P450 [Polyangiaceae bacterium]|nr:cytochrome P450 [Polyangiaceae bacterium]